MAKNIIVNAFLRPIINPIGFDVVRYKRKNTIDKPKKNQNRIPALPEDFDESSTRIIEAVSNFTMISPERINSNIEAIKYIEKNRIEGVIVECGVWKGGGIMSMALALNNLQNTEREFWLYDTFSGMTAPIEEDISIEGNRAIDKFSKTKISNDTSDWAFSPIDEVKENVYSTGYPKDKFHFIEGKVEETIPKYVPEKIALLRLDTDWYESTKHELIHLFPRLCPKGVIIFDDYGHWAGARKATDEYIDNNKLCLFLSRIDYTGRIAIKIS